MPYCRCKGESRPIDGWTVTEVDVNGTMLDVEATCCYSWWYAVLRWGLSQCHCYQMLCGRGKFRKLLPVLTSSHLSPKLRGKCMWPVLTSRTLHRSLAFSDSDCNGHVQRATYCIKSITNFQIPSTRKKGRPQKTWSECVKIDVNESGLAGVDPLDRDAWRAGVQHSLVPVSLNLIQAAK